MRALGVPGFTEAWLTTQVCPPGVCSLGAAGSPHACDAAFLTAPNSHPSARRSGHLLGYCQSLPGLTDLYHPVLGKTSKQERAKEAKGT